MKLPKTDANKLDTWPHQELPRPCDIEAVRQRIRARLPGRVDVMTPAGRRAA